MESKPPVILIAAPEARWMRVLQDDLRRRGAMVYQAPDRGQAVRTAELCPPDIVVLDDDLPSEPGMDLAGHLLEAYPHAELILLWSGSEGCPRGTGMGLLYSGAKPVSADTLMEVIEPALGSRLVAHA